MDATFSIVIVKTGSDLNRVAVQSALTQSMLDFFKVLSDGPTADPVQAPDVLILDDYVVAEHLEHQSSTSKYILLSNRAEPYYIRQVINRGFGGYLYLGDSLVDRLPQAVKDVAAGGRYLSPTASAALARMDHYAEHIRPRITAYQLDVLRLMKQHWSGGRIAAHLGRTTTAIYQVQRFLRDLLDVETNGELLDRAVELGILPDTRNLSP